MPISYPADAKTVALYDLGTGGTNLAGSSDWDLDAAPGGGYWQTDPTPAVISALTSEWTIERSLNLSIGAGAGTILELGAWGETEAVNVQAGVGWDASLRLYAWWETGAGVDHQLLCDDPLPVGTDLSVAVTRVGGRVWCAINGSVILKAIELPLPTGGAPEALTLAVGRSVAAADPRIFTGAGWLRISQPRTEDEIRAAWDAQYPQPAEAAGTFAAIEKAAHARAYWILRGTIGSGLDQVPFAWSTVPLATPTGPIEGRLAEPPDTFTVGIPTAIGAAPASVAVNVVLDNTDGALDDYLLGGSEPQTEYTGPSLYGLEARLYQGFVASDGSLLEEPWTPTLVVSGGFSQANGLISMQLASQDKRLFGRSRRIRTVQQIKEAELVPGTLYTSTYSVWDEADAWEEIRSSWTESLDMPIPWGYGRPLIRLVRVSSRDVARAQFIACCSATEIADPQLSSGWSVYGERDGQVEQLKLGGADAVGIGAWMAKVATEDEDGNPQQIWVYGATSASLGEEYSRLWIVPHASNLIGVGEWEPMTAIDVLRAIIEEHSEAGSAAIDTDSFDRASTALLYSSGAIGGLFGGDGATIEEIIPYIAQPVGIALYIGADDKLHVVLPGAWTTEDAAAAAGDLPVLQQADIYPAGGPDSPDTTWAETAPGDAEDHGAPITWLSVEWAGDQIAVFPPDQRPDRPNATAMTGAKRVDVATDVELRWSGGWVHPPSALLLLDGLASARTFATRTVSCTTHTWVARLGIGALVRAEHPYGIGYGGRCLRLLRASVIPGEHAAQCTFEDVTALELMKRGVLDSEEHWVLYDPADDGVTIVIDQGSDKILLSESVADPSWEKASLWTFGATDPHLRRSWRIVEVVDGSQIRVEPTPDASDVITAAASPAYHRAPWVVMTNAIHAGHEYRPDKIRDCDEQAQTFTDGEPGFQF